MPWRLARNCMSARPVTLFATHAWVEGAWARDVLLGIGADGHWDQVRADVPMAQRLGARVLPAPVLPGVVNAHSHAFQRAIAGLTERSSGPAAASDDFWSWRERMYSVASRISPDQLEAIACFLYAELLAAGYTQVCEFHYLHNAADGQPEADPLEMSLALVRAARSAGIGLTLLPALYMHAGFGATALQTNQRRFASRPESVLRLVEQLRAQSAPGSQFHVGLAVHSLRAADLGAIRELDAHAQREQLPIHIHVAEQTQEVQDCIAATGQRPIEHLLTKLRLDARWNLVHATHGTVAELKAVSQSGASIVLCPSTEANLGDGVFDLLAYADAGGRWSIGSDSHVTRCWTEEMRLLEYSQRMTRRQRNLAGRAAGASSTAGALLQGAIGGGSAASGVRLGGIRLGQRADFLVLDDQSPSLLGVPPGHVLDALVFSSPDARISEVYVAGRKRLDEPQAGAQRARNFAQIMKTLWA